MRKFYVIGISDERRLRFPAEVERIIASGRVFSGGRRHREIVRTMLPDEATWIDITVPLDDVFLQYEEHQEIVVFASGDPLFFGFANTLQRVFPDAQTVTFPSFNSLQMLAHRLEMPYNEMSVVSLTGRPWDDFDAALIEGRPLIGVLTDREKTPPVIAARMLEYGYDNYRMAIGERLGNEADERVRTMQPADVVHDTFAAPNCLILLRTAVRSRPFGVSEKAFFLLDGRVNMITKMPVRLLTLSMLDLRHRSSFWDIGFCTGSVSVEAKLQFPHLRIMAFEKRPEGVGILSDNCRKFGTPGITAVTGDFMEVELHEYPTPDAVFIGGHGGRLVDILRKIDACLPPGCPIVFNSVSAASREMFKEGIRAIGRNVKETVCMTVDAHSPIEIIKAE
ncbi:precorrin-6y C5,15-methyltransferase (decarboxylating) subunit CbiE [Tannerella forsythia]|uniref:precorrin-6y C5,15-methyltransferase (decarboxylating) subunit CbiE n=1 Tax=Tannerella forsythia TaxID=28112 RepID=UPI0028E6C5E8|nr:precorrin-6y C5,15-methyltransferase (decarboxylating) subunit CbiE [Tannerella forsythia]